MTTEFKPGDRVRITEILRPDFHPRLGVFDVRTLRYVRACDGGWLNAEFDDYDRIAAVRLKRVETIPTHTCEACGGEFQSEEPKRFLGATGVYADMRDALLCDACVEDLPGRNADRIRRRRARSERDTRADELDTLIAPSPLPETLPAGTRAVGSGEVAVLRGEAKLRSNWLESNAYYGLWNKSWDGELWVPAQEIDWPSYHRAVRERADQDGPNQPGPSADWLAGARWICETRADVAAVLFCARTPGHWYAVDAADDCVSLSECVRARDAACLHEVISVRISVRTPTSALRCSRSYLLTSPRPSPVGSTQSPAQMPGPTREAVAGGESREASRRRSCADCNAPFVPESVGDWRCGYCRQRRDEPDRAVLYLMRARDEKRRAALSPAEQRRQARIEKARAELDRPHPASFPSHDSGPNWED